MTGIVYFIGAGPGAPDLLTVRAERLIREADVVIYADSLVHPDIARLARPDARVEASSRLTLEQMNELTIEAARAGKTVARLQSGDPSIYGAMHEQLVLLRQANVPYEIVPGVSSAFAAAALLGAELTVPGVSQTVIMTRAEGRTGPLPAGEELRDLACHRASLALFLSGALLRRAVPELIDGGYAPDTPAALVYRATWEDEQVVRGPLAEMAELAHSAGITKQALLMVGGALDPELLSDLDRRSHLYDPTYSHGRRVAAERREARARNEPVDPPAASFPIAANRADLGLAVVAVTRPGTATAERIVAALGEGHVLAPAEGRSARSLLAEVWPNHRRIVLVMALGAATRLIAPLLSQKRSDPAVVVVDDAARFAISLIGGHRAEANELAQAIASAIGAQAVTTTAAEALGLPSVESLARANGWIIENDGVAVTRLAAAIVNGERIGVVGGNTPADWWSGPADQLAHLPSVEALAGADVSTGLIISDQALPRAYASNLDHWVLARPRSLVVGVGCSTGALPAEVQSLVLNALTEARLSPLSVGSLATIDRRLDEPAIVQLAKQCGWQLETYTADELRNVRVPTPSDAVQDAVGTPSVCEAAALLASNHGELLQPKRKNAVATVAIARMATEPRP